MTYQTIRQHTQLRSQLVRTAERRMAKPAYRAQHPMSSIIDGTVCTDETLRFPRTKREAFGHYQFDPAPHRLTFLPRQRGGFIALAAVIAMLLWVAF